ncbi:MAG: branched-chain amino acid ABC transporter permease [Rhodopila sp.]|nr:branched-chain amino acid ABC transporter permease [Rhodopila sp.]
MADRTVLLQLLFSGFGTGGVYALVAVGFSVVYKSTGAVNFAQGEWTMLGGMTTATLAALHLPPALACMIAVPLVGLVGLMSERLAVAPLRIPTPMAITLLTIGIGLATRGAAMLTLGKQPMGYDGFSGNAVVQIAGIRVPAQTLWVLAIAAGFLLLAQLFFSRSVPGKALRALAADRDAAALVGIEPGRGVMWCFALGAFAGGLAGAIVTPLTFISYDQGAALGFKGFSAAILGGLGSLPGAALGGIVLGVAEALAAGTLSSQFKDAIAFAILLLVLFLRPNGLLGRADTSRL